MYCFITLGFFTMFISLPIVVLSFKLYNVFINIWRKGTMTLPPRNDFTRLVDMTFSLLEVYRAMEVVLMDAVDDYVLGIATKEEERHGT